MAEPVKYPWMEELADEILWQAPTRRDHMLSLIAAAFAAHDVERLLVQMALSKDRPVYLKVMRHKVERPAGMFRVFVGDEVSGDFHQSILAAAREAMGK